MLYKNRLEGQQDQENNPDQANCLDPFQQGYEKYKRDKSKSVFRLESNKNSLRSSVLGPNVEKRPKFNIGLANIDSNQNDKKIISTDRTTHSSTSRGVKMVYSIRPKEEFNQEVQRGSASPLVQAKNFKISIQPPLSAVQRKKYFINPLPNAKHLRILDF
jgi:hypothetical protein